MSEFLVSVPTYNGDVLDRNFTENLPEFGDPQVPLLVRCAGGLRVLLGSTDYDGARAPDILIERRPRGWAIFLHPAGSGDPSGLVCLLDDGRSFVVPETCAFPPVVMAKSLDEFPELDTLSQTTHEAERVLTESAPG